MPLPEEIFDFEDEPAIIDPIEEEKTDLMLTINACRRDIGLDVKIIESLTTKDRRITRTELATLCYCQQSLAAARLALTRAKTRLAQLC